jgi:hypothetical protein
MITVGAAQLDVTEISTRYTSPEWRAGAEASTCLSAFLILVPIYFCRLDLLLFSLSPLRCR